MALAERLIAFSEELRGEGVAVGTSELMDAFHALEAVPWQREEDFREARAEPIAKSPEDRHIFELLFDRFFFRSAEEAALRQGVSELDQRDAFGDALGDPEAKPVSYTHLTLPTILRV